MTRVIVCMSWYNERPDWLGAAVASTAPFANHVVAVDGAYDLYPGGAGRSATGQAEAIRETARGLGIGCTIVEPQMPWGGNEVEKRSSLFAHAELVSTADDWYFVLDGDELVSDVAYDDFRRVLRASRYDMGDVTMWHQRDHTAPDDRPFVLAMTEEQRIRVVFRAIRGLRVVGKHYRYALPDGRELWGDGRDRWEQGDDFTPLRIEHRNLQRDLWRAKEARDYYERRDSLGIES